MASGNDTENVFDTDKEESLETDAVPAEGNPQTNNDRSLPTQSSHSRIDVLSNPHIKELPSEGIIHSDSIPNSYPKDVPRSGAGFTKGFPNTGFPSGAFSSKFQSFKPGPGFGSASFMNQNAMASGNLTAIQIGHANNLHFGNNITINHGITKKSGYKPPQKEMPKTKKSTVPVEILTSKVVVSEEIMSIVKDGDLGYKWKDFGLNLNLTSGALDAVEYEHRIYGLNELVFQTMIKWQEKVGDSATVGKLANALDVIGRDDLALSLLTVNKSE